MRQYFACRGSKWGGGLLVQEQLAIAGDEEAVLFASVPEDHFGSLPEEFARGDHAARWR